SRTRGDSLVVVPGQTVHMECRRAYCNKNVIARDKRKQLASSAPSTSPTLRSKSEKFSFQNDCLFCGQSVKTYGQKRGYDVWPVRTKDAQNEILTICKNRGDEWSDIIRGRLQYVAGDLHAADAVYHQTCNVNFRTGKQIPKSFFRGTNSKQQRGRPVDDELKMAFLDVVTYLEENDNEQITITDLVNKMHDICGDSYSVTYMKKKLEEYFGESIIITEINGKHNVVTLRSTASAILHEFYERQKSDDSQTEKLEIKTAAKLIKSEIKEISCSKMQYPTPEEISSESANFHYLPESLRVALRIIFSEKMQR
ncbi:MAG: hypothetical protein N0E48_15925, partial [Candidatus Thiodiazotropha endolucinida]|nr:hypothetical protein [Candidatus Thiodiazotropha taylori]MCW4344820.1 hypothetical protein [Candidatus Thiodiazotropha endolucinida]